MKNTIIVIKTINKEGTEWGLSACSHNPGPDDYFRMVDKETAFRLKRRINLGFYLSK